MLEIVLSYIEFVGYGWGYGQFVCFVYLVFNKVDVLIVCNDGVIDMIRYCKCFFYGSFIFIQILFNYFLQ